MFVFRLKNICIKIVLTFIEICINIYFSNLQSLYICEYNYIYKYIYIFDYIQNIQINNYYYYDIDIINNNTSNNNNNSVQLLARYHM